MLLRLEGSFSTKKFWVNLSKEVSALFYWFPTSGKTYKLKIIYTPPLSGEWWEYTKLDSSLGFFLGLAQLDSAYLFIIQFHV